MPLITTVTRHAPALITAVVTFVLATSYAPTAIAQVHDDHSTATNTTAPVSARQPVVFDLEEIKTDLTATEAPVNGLRQKVLLNEPHITLVMLLFEKGGQKLEHSAPGTATITVMDGNVDFEVMGKPHQLKAGNVIVLQPNVSHNLKATEPSTVLVNISKGNAKTPSANH